MYACPGDRKLVLLELTEKVKWSADPVSKPLVAPRSVLPLRQTEPFVRTVVAE